MPMRVASMDLDLEVFQGPFDLLLTLVLKEEVDLLEVDLAEIVLAYIDHLERAGELDLEEGRCSPEQLGAAIGGLLRTPPPLDLRHVARTHVTVEARLTHLRGLLARRGKFLFDEAVRGADRITEALTLFALLELYKSGEASWEQDEAFAPITVRPVP